MEVDPFAVKLSRKRKLIFEAIVSAGEAGISEEELDRILFSGNRKSTVRSAIHYINKAIYPLRIEGRNGYRLERQ